MAKKKFKLLVTIYIVFFALFILDFVFYAMIPPPVRETYSKNVRCLPLSGIVIYIIEFCKTPKGEADEIYGMVSKPT